MSFTFSGTGNLTQAFVNANIGSASNITITGYSSIGNNAFLNKSQITSINIDTTVTSIGNTAFTGCTSLRSITLNSFLTNLANAFSGVNNSNTSCVFDYSGSILDNICNGKTGVTNVTIGSLITSIGIRSFQSCSLTSITIPNSVTRIGERAFQGCTGLTSITIPNSVTSIGGSAFLTCTSLRSITINSFLTNLGTAFDGVNNSNTSWVFDYSGAILGGMGGRTGVTSVTIGNQITSIGASAFTDCSGVQV